VFFARSEKNGSYAVMPSTLKPLARAEDLIIQEVEDEVLVYDLRIARAHCLSASAALVWKACDGGVGADALADKLDLDEEVVLRALAELEEKDLLDYGPVTVMNGNGNGSTRREFGFRVAKLGALGAAAPMIYSVAIATPMAAATPTPAQCLFYSAQSCDGCKHICGCCCCCQGCSVATQSAACKICFPSSLCSSSNTGPGCSNYTKSHDPCSSGPNCSATADDVLTPGATCSPPCINGAPSVTCGSHACGCNGAFPNPCTP
jgi:hypothetical protein